MASSTIARSSSLMAFGTMASRLLGFIKAMVLATAIGVTSSTGADAFAVANLLPNNVYMVLIGGVLSAVLVPQIVQAMTAQDGGTQYVNKLVTIAGVFLMSITVLALAFAPLLIQLYALSWSSSQLALATAFAYWCLPQIFFYGLFNILGEVLNAKKVFGPSSWAPVLNNVVAIAGLGAFIYLFGDDPDGSRATTDWSSGAIALLAGSATLGVATQALILFVAWKRAGLKLSLDFKWRGVGLGGLSKIVGWSLATVLIMQLGGIITTNVSNTASGKGASIAALQYGWLIFMLPYSVLAFSIGTAYFTRLAEWAHSENMVELRNDVSAAMRNISLAMIGSATVIIVAAPLIAAVIMWGALPRDIASLAVIIILYVIGLPAYGMLFVIQRTYFAFNDTRTPFFFTLVQIVLYVLGSLLMLAIMPIELLAMSQALVFSLATMVQVFVGLIALRRRIGGLDGRRVSLSTLKFGLAAVVTIGAGLGLLNLAGNLLHADSFLLTAVLCAAFGLVMAVLYLALLKLFRADEVNPVFEQLRRRLSRPRA
jgi:putative peptidoglycan lipid II flippase